MDEDAPTDTENVEEFNENEYVVRQKINSEIRRTNRFNPSRIDELAIPNRRLILALYQQHANHLPKDKLEKIKDVLRELYAMTPEETERFFEKLRGESKFLDERRKLKQRLRKELRKLKRAKQHARAVEFAEKLLKIGMEFAFNNPIPPLVSVRLRNLSDIILEQLCDLRDINHPDRDDPDKEGLFLIAVADWIAVIIEHIYFEVQLKKNKDLEEIGKQTEQRSKVDSEIPRRSPDFTMSDTVGVNEEAEGGSTTRMSDLIQEQGFE